MATKAAHTQFNRNVSAYLQSIGAEFQLRNGLSGEGFIKTVGGDLLVSLREPERIEVFSIYCRYRVADDQCNFHSYDAGEVLDDFKRQIEPLLWESIDINDPDFDPTIKL